MTSMNPAREKDTTNQDPPATPEADRDLGTSTESVRISRGERRRCRQAERRARRHRARTTWIATRVDADLPEPVLQRLPGWASTSRGRWLLSGAAVIALLAWALIFIAITGVMV